MPYKGTVRSILDFCMFGNVKPVAVNKPVGPAGETLMGVCSGPPNAEANLEAGLCACETKTQADSASAAAVPTKCMNGVLPRTEVLPVKKAADLSKSTNFPVLKRTQRISSLHSLSGTRHSSISTSGYF
ncbi:unnamed protein product [Pleuronectes platessa]|uniref:Uncharacterized protein n=1 Tax=Pleuronectes platessa TaxID=8262 RepID=A0A9N7TKJ4_PLEPL|nr:unnamed protein product [Pleuronectes platessa]